MTQPRFDLLIRNATLLTAEPDAPLLRDASLGVTGGRIAWVGEGVPQGAPEGGPAATQELDLGGRVITPGFVNVHTHSALSMVRGVAADLGFAPSYTRGIPNALDLSPEEAIAMTRLGVLEALLAGSTLVGEHFVHVDACVPEIAALGLRVHASLRLHDVDFRAIADSGRWEFDAALGEDLLERNLALHAAWHGKHEGRVAVQFAAHAADTCSEPYLRRVAEAAQAKGAVVNTHLRRCSDSDRAGVRRRTKPSVGVSASRTAVSPVRHHHCVQAPRRPGPRGLLVSDLPTGSPVRAVGAVGAVGLAWEQYGNAPWA